MNYINWHLLFSVVSIRLKKSFISYYCKNILSIILLIAFQPLVANAGLLGHLTIMDPILGPRDIVYEKVDGYGLAEGDIILQKLPEAKSSDKKMQALILLKLGGALWPQGNVPYSISESMPLHSKLAILEAMSTWQKETNIKFIERNQSNLHVYSDYLIFVPTENNICSSYVGKQGGPQVIKLAARCGTMNIAHEIGHAIGLWHEQSRGDRDEYIKILWDNIDEKYRYNFNQHLTDGQDFGDYDYQSIMHYTEYAFSKNGEKTILPLQGDVKIGQRDHLSSKDIAAVNAMYH